MSGSHDANRFPQHVHAVCTGCTSHLDGGSNEMVLRFFRILLIENGSALSGAAVDMALLNALS